ILAFAPRGGHLAVAGNDQHEIKVFPILELTKREPRFQTLKSAGSNFRGIAFVKKNNDVALALRSQAADETGPGAAAARIAELKAGDVIFDFSRRRLTADQSGWSIDASAVGDWQGSLIAVHMDARVATVRSA